MLNIILKSDTATKADLDNIAYSFIEPVLTGSVSPIEQWATVKALSEICDRFLKSEDVKTATISEIEKYGKSGTSINGVKLEVSERSVLDYQNCNDPLYNDLKAQKDVLDAKIKERETFLKAVPYSGLEVIIEETGDIVKVFAPAKVTTTSPKVTFPK